jgi:hypothetical protein
MRVWISCGLLGIAVAIGCQVPPVQRVALHVEPRDARLFVDGTEVAAGSGSLELRADLPHVVLARRDGYRSEQIVLETRRRGGVDRLEPDEIRIALEPLVPKQRSFKIEGAEDSAE